MTQTHTAISTPSRTHDDEHVDLNVPRPRPIFVTLAVVVAVLCLVALFLTGFIPKHRQAAELQADAHEAANAPIMVNIAKPRREPTTLNIDLPGTLRPWQEVSLFARTNGYLKKNHVDITSEVKKGDPMADIDAPEVDQELAQSQAALQQANAAVIKATSDRDLAKSTLKRFEALKETQSVTPQNIDEKKSALEVAESAIESAKGSVAAASANVRRLTEMQSFEKIVAPFDGVVTGRGYDPGALILANPTATDIRPLFKIAENDILRAFVNVPQSAALQIRKGMEVQLTVRERPGRTFTGQVLGTTNYLDPANRTMLTQVKVINPKEPDGGWALLPGMYIQARFNINRDTPPLIIPGPALVANSEGTQVVVMENGQAKFKKVTLGQDFGNEVEVTAGLSDQDQIIANPGERIVEGVTVSAGTETADQPPAAGTPPRVKLTEANK